MGYLQRGALIEYGADFLSPIPNVVVFQFNPESLSRNVQIPTRPTGSESRETTQAGDLPVEKISFTAQFSAADLLGKDNPLARAFGVGWQLAALEKMSRPTPRNNSSTPSVDAVASAAASTTNGEARQPIPREQYPRLLFIWGTARLLPVMIESMNVTEQKYDASLNPVQAEVALSLAVLSLDPNSEDLIAKGALAYTNLRKETQALESLANAASKGIADLINF